MEFEESPGAEAPAVIAPERAGISALIIDDERHVRLYLRTTLRSLGVTEIHEAANGAEGVTRFVELAPTLVLLDVNMPAMNGDAALAQILAHDPAAAVVIVTSDNQHETVKRFRTLGVMGYVLKHRPPAELRAMLAEVLACFVIEGEA